MSDKNNTNKSSQIGGATPGPRLTVRRLSKRYGNVQALDEVDFELYPGEVMALLGENGAGKSTLVKILSGLVQPDSGAIEIGGRPAVLWGSMLTAYVMCYGALPTGHCFWRDHCFPSRQPVDRTLLSKSKKGRQRQRVLGMVRGTSHE